MVPLASLRVDMKMGNEAGECCECHMGVSMMACLGMDPQQYQNAHYLPPHWCEQQYQNAHYLPPTCVTFALLNVISSVAKSRSGESADKKSP